jgi:hypothetical protein
MDKYEKAEMELAKWIDRELYLPLRDELKGRGTHTLGAKKENLKVKIIEVMEKLRKNEI